MESQTTASAAVQAVSPQELTDPVETALFQTPTLTFGEIGFTGDQVQPGYASNAHSVGHFEDTRLLERMMLLEEGIWATTDTGQLFAADVDAALRALTRNAAVLAQFRYYRSDVELTVRLNTNQFYYGALMITLWPGRTSTGLSVDARAVLDPTVISASSAESVIKTYEYMFPDAWLQTSDSNVHPINLSIDILAPLTAAKQTMPSSITFQVWARFKNIQLAFPIGPTSLDDFEDIQAQASRGAMPSVRYPRKSNSTHPADDSASGTNSIDNAISAIQSVTVGDAIQEVKSLASFVTENWGSITSALGFLFDKPDKTVEQSPIIIEPMMDYYTTDIPDSNPTACMYKSRYVDPGKGRMPMSKNWTVSDYARIPGLRTGVFTFTAKGNSVSISPIQIHPTTSGNRIPLDYAYICSRQWRGSIKLMLQFFTSAFISARFTLQYNNAIDGVGYPIDYTNGLTKVINVKGDTVDTITLPWLHHLWWTTGTEPQFLLTCESTIASVDTVADPKIYCIFWVAGGDDIQFAFPRIPNYALEWSASATLEEESLPKGKRKKGKEKIEAQAAIGKMFQSTFAPIGENVNYDIDHGFCTSENLGPITDICKRYSVITPIYTDNVGFSGPTLDFMQAIPSIDQFYHRYFSFRNTFFGTWRHAFLFRSGGFKFRFYDSPEGDRSSWRVNNGVSAARTLSGTDYFSPQDGMTRLTVPQVALRPFGMLNYDINTVSLLGVGTPPVVDADHPQLLAARDDLQFGMPILPIGASPSTS